MEKSETCQMCGTGEWEWSEDPDAYRAAQVVCAGCAVKDRARADDDTDRSIPGASIRLFPRRIAERMNQVRSSRPLSRRERSRHE